MFRNQAVRNTIVLEKNFKIHKKRRKTVNRISFFAFESTFFGSII